MFLKQSLPHLSLAEEEGSGLCEVDDSSDDVETLRQAVLKLKSTNRKLQAALQAKGTDFIKCGYLFKYRPFAHGLWDNPWERRFFVLRKGTIEYFRTEADTQYPPRGMVKLEACVVEIEPLKKRKFFTFSVIDEEQNMLALRVSTGNIDEGERWVTALEMAGVTRRDTTKEPLRSPRQAKDIRGGSRGSSSQSHSKLGSSAADLLRKSLWKVPFFPLQEGATDVGSTPVIPVKHTSKSTRGPFTGGVPVHAAPKFSMLSSEEVGNQNHAGLINLVMVIMFATHSRLIIENSLKYGVRFNPLYWVTILTETELPWQVLICWPLLAGFIGISFWIEVLAARALRAELKAKDAAQKKSDGDAAGQVDNNPAKIRGGVMREPLFNLLQCATLGTLLLLPCWVIVRYEAPALAGLLLITASVIYWMKMVSYAHCCSDLRSARRTGEIRPGERGNTEGFAGVTQPLLYPENVNTYNLAYFCVAPTLTYQVNYPRSSRFRKRWVARRLLELVAWLSVGAFIIEQYILPSCLNSLHPLNTMDIGHILERVLKLSLPSLYVWLIAFYCIFHLWLNILAEFTYFGDRQFYSDWWNATTVDEYWRKWNQPVHKWLMRTVYFPCMRLGLSRYVSILATFLVSAVFHELLVGVPLHMLRAWAFAGMMGQIPLIAITNILKRKLKSDIVGNVIFWLSFCIFGQPTAVLLYYHDYIQEHM